MDTSAYNTYTQYPQHFAAPPAQPAVQTAIEKPATYRGREIAEKYDISRSGNRLNALESAFDTVKGRLNSLGEQLRNLGKDDIKFKANHLDHLQLDPSRPLDEVYNVMEHQSELATKEIKDALASEFNAKKAIDKAKAQDSYVNAEFNRLFTPQATRAQTTHKDYNHSYPKHSQGKIEFTIDIAKTAATIAFIASSTIFGGIGNAFVAFNVLRALGL